MGTDTERVLKRLLSTPAKDLGEAKVPIQSVIRRARKQAAVIPFTQARDALRIAGLPAVRPRSKVPELKWLTEDFAEFAVQVPSVDEVGTFGGLVGETRVPGR